MRHLRIPSQSSSCCTTLQRCHCSVQCTVPTYALRSDTTAERCPVCHPVTMGRHQHRHSDRSSTAIAIPRRRPCTGPRPGEASLLSPSSGPLPQHHRTPHSSTLRPNCPKAHPVMVTFLSVCTHPPTPSAALRQEPFALVPQLTNMIQVLSCLQTPRLKQNGARTRDASPGAGAPLHRGRTPSTP